MAEFTENDLILFKQWIEFPKLFSDAYDLGHWGGLLHNLLFNSYKVYGLIAKDQFVARTLNRRVRDMMQRVPEPFRRKFDGDGPELHCGSNHLTIRPLEQLDTFRGRGFNQIYTYNLSDPEFQKVTEWFGPYVLPFGSALITRIEV